MAQTFAGTQNVSNSQEDEAWKVNVRVHGFDPDHGYLCGIMEALNVPSAETPVNRLSCMIPVEVCGHHGRMNQHSILMSYTNLSAGIILR